MNTKNNGLFIKHSEVSPEIFAKETLYYDVIFQQAYDNKVLKKAAEWMVKVIRKMSKNSIIASTREAQKYDVYSINRDEIDAVMLAGANLAHLSLYELENATLALKEESPEQHHTIVTTHRAVRVKYFMNNSMLESVGHALEVVRNTHVYSDEVLVDVFNLIPK